jgi:hypothetical protein
MAKKHMKRYSTLAAREITNPNHNEPSLAIH